MAALTILMSGPVGTAVAAGHALTRAGLKTDPTGAHSHGLPDEPAGTTWLAALAGDEAGAHDLAARALEGLGWTLRMHWHTPPAPDLSPVAGLEARIARLEAAAAAKGPVSTSP